MGRKRSKGLAGALKAHDRMVGHEWASRLSRASGIARRIKDGRIDDNETAMLEGRAGGPSRSWASVGFWVAVGVFVGVTAYVALNPIRDEPEHLLMQKMFSKFQMKEQEGLRFGKVRAAWVDATGYLVVMCDRRVTGWMSEPYDRLGAFKEVLGCDGTWRYYFAPKGVCHNCKERRDRTALEKSFSEGYRTGAADIRKQMEMAK